MGKHLYRCAAIAVATLSPGLLVVSTNGVAAATTIPTTSVFTAAEQEQGLVAALEAGGRTVTPAELAASTASAALTIQPETVESINEGFDLPVFNGCEVESMFGNFLGTAYGNATITSGSDCFTSVYIAADQDGTTVYGPTESTFDDGVEVQSTVASASVIGESIWVCYGSSCINYIYTAF